MKSIDSLIGIIGSVLCGIFTATAENPTYQIINAILTAVTSIVTIAFIIWKWVVKAKSKDSDGGEAITADEVTDLINDLSDVVEKKSDEEDN